jgi:hypothetical protein
MGIHKIKHVVVIIRRRRKDSWTDLTDLLHKYGVIAAANYVFAGTEPTARTTVTRRAMPERTSNSSIRRLTLTQARFCRPPTSPSM